MENIQEAEVMSTSIELVVPKLVPDVLVINGVETSPAIMAALKEEVLAMKIDGILDDEGYNKVSEKLKLVKKAKTSEEKWRKDLFAPFLKFKKEVDDRITKENSGDYKTMQEHLEAQLKPIDDYKEIARQEAELEKERIAGERAELVVQCGGVFDGKGTYNFPHDSASFILADKLKSMNEEQWQVEYKAIQDSWKVESDRLQDIENAKKAEETKLQALAETQSQEIIDTRIDVLEARGYILNPITDRYCKEEKEITQEQLTQTDRAAWLAILNPPTKEEVIINSGNSGTSHQGEVLVAPPSDISTEFDLPEIDLSADLHQSLPEVLVAEINKPEPEMVEPITDAKTISCEFQFSKADPFLEFVIGNGFSMRLYPEELEKEALEGLETATNGIALEGEEGNLLFALIQS